MLVVFVRNPEPGQAKTRLIPAVGPVAAADIQHRMSLHTLGMANAFGRDHKVDVQVRFTGGTAEQLASLYGADFQYRDQGEGDLGQRLKLAVADAFDAGARAAVVIGTDCPKLSARHLRDAHEALLGTDVVLGPALDGGYYLIGLRQPHQQLFDDIAWSTERVLQQTLDQATRLGLSVKFLEELPDIDRPEDLQHLPP